MPDSGLERRQTSSCFRECTRCRCLPLSVRALLPLIFALVFWSCTMAAALFFGNALYDQRLSEKPFKDSGFKWSFDWKGALGPTHPKLFVCAAGSPDSFFSMRVEDAATTTTTTQSPSTPSPTTLHPLVEFARSFNNRKDSMDFSDDELDHIALLANEGIAYAENTRDVYPFPFELNSYYAAAHFFMLLVFVVFQGRRSPIVLKRLLLLLAASQVLFHAQLTVTQFPDPLLPCLPFASEAVSSPTLIVTTPDGGASVSHVSISSGLGDDTPTTTTTTTVPPSSPSPLGGIEDTKDGYTWRLSGPRQWLYSNQPAQYTIGALFVQFYCTSWPVRIISWIVAIGGIFVLVPTHYLYTVDVMTGVICALSVFLMYHWSVRTTLSIEKRWWVRWLEYDQICLQRYGRLLLCGVHSSGFPNGEDDQLIHRSSPNTDAPHNSNNNNVDSINRYSAPVTPGEARILTGGTSPTDSRQKGAAERRNRGSSGNQSMTTIATSSPHIPIQERLGNNIPRHSPRENDVDSNHGHGDDNSQSSNDIVAEAVVEAGAITHHKDTERARTSSSLGVNGSNNKNSKRSSRKNSSQGGGGVSGMDGEENAADFAPQSALGKIQRAAIIQHEENVRAIQRRPSNNNVSAASPNELYATGNSGTGGFGASITIPGAVPQGSGYHDENGFYHESYELASSDYALEHFRVPTLTLVDKARFLTLILDEVEHEFYSVFSPHVPIQDQPSSQPHGVTEATSTDNTPSADNREDDGNTAADRISNKNSILGSRQSEGYFSCASGPSQGGGGGGGGTSSNTSSKGLGSRRSSAQSMPEEDSDEDTTYFRNRNTSGGPVQHVLGTVSDRPRPEDSSPLGPPLTTFSAKEGKENIRIRTDSVRHSTAVEGIAPVVVPAMSEDDQEAILYKLWLRRWFIILSMGVVCGGSGAASAFINIISINVADKNRPIGIPLPPDVTFHFLPAVPPHTPDFLLYSQVAAVFIYMGLSRYRFVMIRRAALMYGICMMGRCLTVPATFPIDPSILCKARIHPEGTTCGDLIYSGHTIAFIVSLAVILKYVRPLWVRAGFCAYTLCGLVAVVTSRLHYTRDVLTAVLVTGTVYYLCHRTLFHRYDLFLRHPRLRFLELDYFSILVEDRALAQQGKTRRHLWIKGSVGETFGSIADAWEKRKRRQERERRRRQGEV